MRIALVSAVLRLTVFWWLLTSALSFWQSGGAGWRTVGTMLTLSAIGVCGGISAVWASVLSHRKARIKMMQPDEVRGLSSSIGEIPFLIQPPPESEDLPQLVTWPNVPSNFFVEWRARYLVSHPKHVALFDRLLRIYNEKSDRPATHVPGGHGGRTLLEHSLLCAFLMYKHGENWMYKGLASRSDKKRVIVELRDPDYRYDCNDPLAVLIGLAHDLGKVESFRYDKTGKVVGIRNEHDLTGARILARLDELWELSDSDRSAILLAIAHYHHPVELPLHADRGAIDDRTIALMELLIKTDNNAGNIEHQGRPLTEREYDELHSDVDGQEDIPAARMWEVFCDMVHEPNVINQKARSGIGLYLMGPGLNAPHLFINSKDLAGLLEQQLGVAGKNLGDGRHSHVVRLMEALANKNVLLTKIRIKSGQDEEALVEMPSHSAIWDVDFMEKEAKTEGFKKKTGWYCIVVDLRRHEALQDLDKRLKAHKWIAYFKRPMMGLGRAKKTSEEQETASGVAADELMHEEPEVAGDSGPIESLRDAQDEPPFMAPPALAVAIELPTPKDDRLPVDVDYGAITADHFLAKRSVQRVGELSAIAVSNSLAVTPNIPLLKPAVSDRAAVVAPSTPTTINAASFVNIVLPSMLHRATQQSIVIDQLHAGGRCLWIFKREVCAQLVPEVHWKKMKREFRDFQEKGLMQGCLFNDGGVQSADGDYSLLIDGTVHAKLCVSLCAGKVIALSP